MFSSWGKRQDPNATAIDRSSTLLNAASQATLVATIAGQVPLVGAPLAGAFKLAAAALRIKGLSIKCKRFAREIQTDVTLSAALVNLMIAIKTRVPSIKLNFDPIKDSIQELDNEVKRVQENPNWFKDLAFIETTFEDLKNQAQDVKNDLTAAYPAIDLELAVEEKTTLRELVYPPNVNSNPGEAAKDKAIKTAWDEYKAAQAPAGGRRKSRRRRSRKGKTFRRKRQ